MPLTSVGLTATTWRNKFIAFAIVIPPTLTLSIFTPPSIKRRMSVGLGYQPKNVFACIFRVVIHLNRFFHRNHISFQMFRAIWSNKSRRSGSFATSSFTAKIASHFTAFAQEVATSTVDQTAINTQTSKCSYCQKVRLDLERFWCFSWFGCWRWSSEAANGKRPFLR